MEVRMSETLEAYCARLQAAGLDAPWARPGPLIASKQSRAEACLWRWREIEPLLLESAEFVTPSRGAERRILRLANPGVPERTSTHTLSTAVQYLLPGETAPAHRHTPNAIRFMLRGQGACTVVEGQRCAMVPGDLVLTPSMSWHEHGNEGTEPVIWLDGLDSPVVRFLEILAMESGPASDSVRKIHTRTTIHYRWDSIYQQLRERARVEPSPFDDVLLEYVDPATGTSVLPTMGCYVQLIRPGVQTRAHRQSSSAVYYVFQGTGSSTIDDVTYEWGEGDFFVVPPLAEHKHANGAKKAAILFSLQDVPLLTALGLYYETPSM